MRIDLTIGKPTCFIPARGRSKRVKDKNKRMLCGKPLLLWTVEPAVESDLFDKVIVSSDDEEILEIAYSAGATPHWEKVFEGKYPLRDVVKYLIDIYKPLQVFCMLQPTSPQRGLKEIREAYRRFDNSYCNYLYTGGPKDNGAILFASVEAFMKELPESCIGEKSEVMYLNVVDIDTERDFRRAECIMCS